jgi:hypothetical protein
VIDDFQTHLEANGRETEQHRGDNGQDEENVPDEHVEPQREERLHEDADDARLKERVESGMTTTAQTKVINNRRTIRGVLTCHHALATRRRATSGFMKSCIAYNEPIESSEQIE